MITFDPDKDQANTAKHGVSLSAANLLEWDSALTWQDDRKEYGELRLVSLVPAGERLYCCVYVDREGEQRIISLRKANKREVTDYAENG